LLRKFNLITDHKPLLTIFHLTKGIPETAASHLQRWAIILSAYDYIIQYKPSARHAKPLTSDENSTDTTNDLDVVCAMEQQQLDCLPVQATDIQKATMEDPVFTLHGWPNSL